MLLTGVFDLLKLEKIQDMRIFIQNYFEGSG
jgi:hypothetical protein